MRWKVALALVPVLYVPACVATHAFEVWRAKTPVASAPAGEFPLLQRKGNVLQIVRYNARDSHATYLVPPSAQQQLDAQHKPDDPDQIYAQVDFESLRSGLQRVHVKTAHELAMGYIRTESWYDTDGKSIVPRFEREYLPTWMLLWACALAVPVAVIAATAAAPVVRRWNAPPAAAARAAIAAILFVVA
ncbi:MAG TPA: hypothetical protein VJ853_07240, partial [Thermoanaerobaculia bacterium]|nr:hypothetical protein [Thermoanaerobaculia bacterium]